ncbi:MAG: acetate--CoA ligase [Armatimonadota bacterium]|nr:acetate--CoA ligase [Armatimonadota bacterium]MCX7776469.1 acetate--CoA ligase [Armatimonadota bacterium]MDW8024267.1 acetate--CoA ligase [Armatimonadota bacterium]
MMSALKPRKDLKPVFCPHSIAVIGASRDPNSVGQSIFRNILMGGYRGVLYPVNPRADFILSVKAYPSIMEVPGDVDLAVIVVPAPIVPQVLDECGRKGVKGAIVISAGFKEIGGEGIERERRIKEIADNYGIALIGPNCLGVINTDPAVSMNASFAGRMPQAGRIAFISQSGALCTAVLDYARGQNIGFSKIVSMGNKADVDESDILVALAEDPQTSVILMYLEELTSGRRFFEVARVITSELPQPKPILAIKAGRTPAGARAASSHTGALSGSDEVYEAILAQAGVLRVESVEELFDYAEAFVNQPLPNGPRLAIVTNAGGPAIMAADACMRYGLELANLTETTRSKLKSSLPPAASVHNPIDLIGDAQHDRYELALGMVMKDPNVDMISVLLTPQAMTDVEEVAKAIVRISKADGKPIVATFMGWYDVSPGVKVLNENGIPHYSFPEQAVRALSAMYNFVKWLTRPRTEVKVFTDVNVERAKEIIQAVRASKRRMLREDEALSILEAYNFPLIPWGIASTREEAAKVACEIGFPVAMKILSPDIVHKFDVGGVILNLGDERSVIEAFDRMMQQVSERCPGARIDGVLIQKMATKGIETIIGMKRDQLFGPMLMFGLGGVYVEVLKDVTFRVAPVRELDALRMIRSVRSAAILEGYRGQPPSDIDAIVECICRLSQLALDCEDIEELDVNPLMVFQRGEGATVLDARILLTEA